MKTAKVIREERAAKQEQMQALHEKAKAEKRALSAEEKKQWEDLYAETESLKEELSIAERQEAIDMELAAQRGTKLHNASTQEKRDLAKFSILKMVRSVIENKPLDGLEAEMHQEAQKEARTLGQNIVGLGIPSMVLEMRDNSITMPTQPEDGSAIMVQATQRPMLDMLRNALVTRQLGATYLNDLVGNISFTAMTERPKATWKPEVGNLDKSNTKYSSEDFGPKRLGTYTVHSKQFLLQTAASVEAKIRSEIMYSIAEGVDEAAIKGSGVDGEPTGILTYAVNGDIDTIALGTDGGSLTRAQLIAAETNLAAKNLTGRTYGWLINALTRGKLKNTQIIADSEFSERFLMENNNSLMEYPVVMSNMVPSNLSKGAGTNLSAVIFGDWSELNIGQWGGIDLLVDPYTLAVGGQVKIVAQGFFNVHIVRKEAFVTFRDVVTTLE